MKLFLKQLMILGVVAGFLLGCSNKKTGYSYTIDTPTEISQQIGDTMAAIDEIGGTTSGDITMATPLTYEKSYARMNAPNDVNSQSPVIYSLLVPEASAGTCTSVGYSACSSSTRSRVLTGCSTAASGGTLAGNISLTFAGPDAATCSVSSTGDTVTRVANISVRGLRGTQFGTRPTSTGQVISYSSPSTFTYNDTGTNRSFTDPDSKVLLSVTTTTPTPLTISGSNRNGRTITAGDILVTNGLTGVTCDFVPTGVTWATGCNCPTAGTWSATCSDSLNFSVAFTSTCGQANIMSGSVSATVTMDRCDTN